VQNVIYYCGGRTENELTYSETSTVLRRYGQKVILKVKYREIDFTKVKWIELA